MAQIYLKNTTTGTDQCLALAPREALSRQINFSGSFGPISGSWQELRIGMYISVVSGSSPSGSGPAETAIINTPMDYFTFGLKDTQTTILPGYSGSTFIGVGAWSTNITKVSNALGQNGSSNLYAFGTNGTYGSSSATGLFALSYPADPSINASYAAFFGVRIIINNSGSSNQSLSIYNGANSPGNYPYTTATLISELNTFPNQTGPAVLNWTSASLPLPIPDGVWVRMPLYNNAIRISSIYAKRYA